MLQTPSPCMKPSTNQNMFLVAAKSERTEKGPLATFAALVCALICCLAKGNVRTSTDVGLCRVAVVEGGGIAARDQVSATLMGCFFLLNEAMSGGGVSAMDHCNVTGRSSTWELNEAETTGGGIKANATTPVEGGGSAGKRARKSPWGRRRSPRARRRRRRRRRRPRWRRGGARARRAREPPRRCDRVDASTDARGNERTGWGGTT